MSGCDYCDEKLPLWHRGEDPEGFEGAQLVPCQRDIYAQLETLERENEALSDRLMDEGSWPKEQFEIMQRHLTEMADVKFPSTYVHVRARRALEEAGLT